jgi:hypothetical protein
MQKEDVWNAYVKRNPSFQTGDVSFTPNGIRKFFDQTWKLAYQQGIDDAQPPAGDLRGSARPNYEGDEFVKDFFGGIFNGRKKPEV